MNRTGAVIYSYARLCKMNISFLASFSAAAGYSLSALSIHHQLIPVFTGVFILSCGASAFNQYQERDIDALMPRTRNRPLPAKEIDPPGALSFSIIFIVIGLLLLFLRAGSIAACLGLIAVILYNVMYTSIKRKSAIAVIPGALIGVIPPAIGWVAGGGALLDNRLLLVCFFFFMWQIPHFWLYLLKYGEEYERAGIPTVTTILSKKQLRRIIFIWITAVCVSCLLTWVGGVIHASLSTGVLYFLSIWLVCCGVRLLHDTDISYPCFFNKINLYMFLVLTLVFADRFLV